MLFAAREKWDLGLPWTQRESCIKMAFHCNSVPTFVPNGPDKILQGPSGQLCPQDLMCPTLWPYWTSNRSRS